MPSEDKILDCYTWSTGTCFRCARDGVETAHIEWIVPRSGERHDVRACRPCVLVLEGMRKRCAERTGEPYQPGGLGGDAA